MPKPLKRIRRFLSFERSAKDLGITVDELKQTIADGELLQWGEESILWHFDRWHEPKIRCTSRSEAIFDT
jgi:hypothetical protein